MTGFDDFVALTAGGFVSAINAALDVIRNRRAKSLSILVLILFVLSSARVFATRDARIILLKPSIFIGAASLWLLLESAGRVILVFALPVNVSVIASILPGALLVVFFALIGRFYLKGAAEQAMGEQDE